MDAKHLFLSFFVGELASKSATSCLADGIIYSLQANGMLIFIPKYGIRGAVYLKNKDKKVAVVKEEVEWVQGQLEVSDSALLVKADGVQQKYSIFDHITVSVFCILF